MAMNWAPLFGAMLSALTFTFTATADELSPAPIQRPAANQNRHFIDTADHVRIDAVDYVTGDDDEFIVKVAIDTGFHVNANPASLPYLIPTTLHVTSQTPLRVVYPSPVSFKPKFAEQAIDVYEGSIQIVADFPRGFFTPDTHVFGTLTVQACTDEICLPPASLPLPAK
jgi:uncharacterized protein